MQKQLDQQFQNMHLGGNEQAAHGQTGEAGEAGEEGEAGEVEGEEGGGKWEKIEQPQKQVPLFMVDFQQCDSKKCTGKKMQRFKLLTSIKDKKKKYKGVVLSAFGKKFVSKEDLQYIEKYGICVIDCSWNRIEETREFRYKHERKLPFVVAGNPVNFGKPYQLSCVQAMATALCAVGYLPQAKYILSKFGWADSFWKQNPDIQSYVVCANQQQIELKSKQNETKQQKGFQRNYQFPSDESDEQAQEKTETTAANLQQHSKKET